MKTKTVWWLFIILWCGMIFYQSSMTAPLSDKQSMLIVTAINRVFSVLAGKEMVVISNHLVRKSAHFTEYLVLGILLFNGFFSGKAMLKAVAYSLVAGICYAVSDEFHQYFVPGRTMRAFDVMIDGLGVFFGAGLMFLSVAIRYRNIQRN